MKAGKLNIPELLSVSGLVVVELSSWAKKYISEVTFGTKHSETNKKYKRIHNKFV